MRLIPALLILGLVAGMASAQDELSTPPPTVEPSIEALPDDGLDELRKATRSAKLAIAMSFPFPGWGQLYADSPFWAVAAWSVQAYYLGSNLLERQRAGREDSKVDLLRAQRSAALAADSGADVGSLDRAIEARMLYADEHKERARDYAWWAAGAWFIIALDAFVSVELADFDRSDPPTPDLDRDWGDGEDGAGMALRLNFTF